MTVSTRSISTYKQHDNKPMVTYDSGADGHYLSKQDRTKLGLPILRIPDKKVGVSNGGTCNGKYVTSLLGGELMKPEIKKTEINFVLLEPFDVVYT